MSILLLADIACPSSELTATGSENEPLPIRPSNVSNPLPNRFAVATMVLLLQNFSRGIVVKNGNQVKSKFHQ